MSAIVLIKNKGGKFVQARALLDTCSTAHFITTDFVRQLQLTIKKCSVSVSAMNSMRTESEGSIDILIKSRFKDFEKSLTALVVPKISDANPSETFKRESIEIPRNLPLADPRFHLPRPVDLLIGSGATLSLLSVGQINLSRGNCDLYLQKTQLGWVIAGGHDDSQNNYISCNLLDLNKQLTRFWEVEDCGGISIREQEDKECEAHYVKNTTRNEEGKYIVRLPFRDPNVNLGNSRNQALRRFHALQKSFQTNPQRYRDYSKVINEHLERGYVSRIEDSSSEGYFLPHHAVIKTASETTKLRVVFDASAKTDTGHSLNGALMTGPCIQPKLFEHLLRFRTYRYVLIADIEKMYLQILMHIDDRKYQKFFWFYKNKIDVFQLNTVTFGVSAAAFLAIRTLQQLAEDEKDRYPLASAIVRRDFYVDDFLTGSNSLEELEQIRTEMTELLASGGFNIRQWASNCDHTNDNNANRVFESTDREDEQPVRKTLGIAWDPKIDSFIFTVKSIELTNKITKRFILSEIAKIFDPLGFLGPVVLSLKIIIQECWKAKVSWDETVPQALHSKWITFAEQMSLIKDLTIPRFLLPLNPVAIEVHGFCDASNRGYGACLYIRSIDERGKISVNLACAKSRVAPVKEVTIPRLELCGAVILVRLFNEAKYSFNFPIDRIVFWSDSEIVLQWLKKNPQSLTVFEGNRVAEIQRLSEGCEWRHVRSKNNMADVLSRGQSPVEFIQNKTWFEGHPWIRQSSDTWQKSRLNTDIELPGIRQNICLLAQPDVEPFYKELSSYSKIIATGAYCMRLFKRFRGAEKPKTLTVTPEERIEIERRLLRTIQSERFSVEIKLLKNKMSLNGTKIALLSPFIDEQGLIRVGGRLCNAQIPYAQKYPILLPSKHHVTDLIIRETHGKLLHAGIQSTLYQLRLKYWILDGKNQVRKIVRGCNTCIRHRPVPVQCKMGDLPKARVTQAEIFDRVGVDFLGPISMKEKKERNRVVLKAYGCIFICMVTKGVHVEIATDLSTDTFLAAFRRFISRRGRPSHVYSDNGTNFVGANNKLRDLFEVHKTEQHQKRVSDYASSEGIAWHFNPPLAPHFGGLWEASVKSFKHHFERVTGGKLLTFEQLDTLAKEIEAILNSRPICMISNDPNDPVSLTPAHFLIGRPITMVPEHDYTSVAENRLTVWNFVTRARQDFWKRWHIEYLNELQKRQKWLNNEGSIKIGSIVLIIEKKQPCCEWLLGRVVEISPGSDGIVRVAKVKTAQGDNVRSVTKLCPLPNIEEPDNL